MTTSLAQQLQSIRQAASSNTFQKKKRVASILCDPSEAADQDYDQVFAIANNGFEELITYDSALLSFGQTIFSDESRTIDRYTQTKDQNDALDRKLGAFITSAAPHFLLRPMQKCLEWLIRRFDIHVHVPELLLVTFLPFHGSPVYAKLLTIIELPAPWAFLAAVKKANEPPNLFLFVKSFSKARSTLRTFLEHVQKMAQNGKNFHSLITVYAEIAVRTIAIMRDSNVPEEEICTMFLPYVAHALALKSHTEYQVANYMVLTVLAASRSLDSSASIAAARSLALGLTVDSQKSGLLCLAQLCQSQESVEALPKDVYLVLSSLKGCFELMMDLAQKYCFANLLTSFSLSAVEEATTASLARVQVIFQAGFATYLPILSAIAQKVLASADLPDFRLASARFLEQLQGQSVFKPILDSFYKNLGPKVDDLELALQITFDLSTTPALSTRMRRQSSTRVTSTVEDDIAELPRVPAGETYLSVSDVRRTINVLQAATNVNKYEEFLESPVINESPELMVSFLVRSALSSNDVQTQLHSLSHLTKFCKDAPNTDFQALVPVAISLLSSKSQEVRRLTLATIEILSNQIAVKTKKTIWGLDNLYGAQHSQTLRWMSSSESQHLLDQILASRAECLLDHKVIYRVVGQAITTHGTKGKELSHCAAALHFLASHIISSPITKIVLKLLLCFDKIIEPSAAKTKAVLPLLERVVEDAAPLANQSEIELIDPVVVQRLLIRQVVASENGPGISLLLSQVKKQTDALGPMSIEWLSSIFDHLRRTTQTEFVRLLIEAIIDGPSSVSRQARISIDKIDIPTDLFLQMIEEINLSTTSSRLSTPVKKQKKEVANTLPENHVRRFTHLLEVLERSDTKHAALLPILFSKLGDLVLIEAESAMSISYAEQILLSCMYTMVDPGKLDPTTCRIDILINCIRTSSSPQVHNRALLLVAALAEAAPEQVLHGVMPIFTFMGANILRQDDGFSAHVIESTIQRVVPPLLATLGDETEDQILGAAGILRSFVDAFPHVPKHRRIKLFLVLVQTLGADVFLAPLLAVFAQKRIEILPKNKSGESQRSYLEFSLSLLRQFSVGTQLKSIVGLLEIARSVPESASQITEEKTLISYTIADDAYLDKLKVSLISIIGSHFAAKKVRSEFEIYANSSAWADKDMFIGVIESLLKASDQYEHHAEAQEKTLDALDRAITLLPINLFEVVSCDLLKNKKDEFLKLKTLEMVASRASSTDNSDADARAVFLALVEQVSELLVESSSASLLCSSFQCISSLGRRFGKVDPGRFMNVAPLAIGATGLAHAELIVRVAAIECLTTIVVVLGPRILPQLQKFMPIVLDNFTKVTRDEDADLMPLATASLLESLVKSIPTFMTPYTQAIVEKSADFSFATEELTSDKRILLATVAQNMPTRNVIEAIGAAWKSCVPIGKKSLLALATAIEETIESTERRVMTGCSKEILDLFLQALNIRRECHSWDARAIEQIEKRVISVLLKVVLKMNDSTFRPLFLKLRDWAMSELLQKDPAALQLRQITFFNFFSQFTHTFKSIVLNYFDYVLEDIRDILQQATEGSKIPRRLWVGVINSLANGFSCDNEDFWRNSDRFDRLAPLLISHLKLAETYPVASVLVPAIVELTSASSSKEHSELINNQVLDLFRSETAAVRLTAVITENQLSAKMGEEWLLMLPKIIPYLYDALEDEDEQVEKQTHALAMTIESYLGESLDPYLR